ncbi:MAG TPA: hypothetical protein VK667_05370, partial [Ktedonobacteraceae bacterium]|nr:hypothetical protein [Ktedonobacteraceae bacterium]
PSCGQSVASHQLTTHCLFVHEKRMLLTDAKLRDHLPSPEGNNFCQDAQKRDPYVFEGRAS